MFIFGPFSDCPPQIIPSNAIFSTEERYEGIVVVVSCDTGFTRFGNQNITCLAGGFWDKSLPTCRRGIIIFYSHLCVMLYAKLKDISITTEM